MLYFTIRISDKIYPKKGEKMGTKLNPYINFKDNTRAAMKFYQSVFGGKLTLSTFKEFQASADSEEDDKIMHSELEAENGIVFMAADTPSHLAQWRGSGRINGLFRKAFGWRHVPSASHPGSLG
jgi:hypothetical protein